MFYFITCSIIWGLTWIAIQFQFNSAHPNVAVFYRFIVASALLFAFCYLRKIKLRFEKQDHLNFVAQGFFMFFLNYQMTYWASQLAPSALVALAFTALIYFNLFGGHFFMGLPIDRKVAYGAVISFVGMTFITLHELQDQSIQATSAIGFLISLAATVSASCGNLGSMKSRKRQIPVSSNNAWGMLYGAGFSLIYSLVMQRSFELHSIDSAFIWSFLYLTIFGTIFSFGAYLKLIETMGPSKAAFTSVISPIIAIAASMMFENLQVSVGLALGIILCLAGNIVALTPQNYLKRLRTRGS